LLIDEMGDAGRPRPRDQGFAERIEKSLPGRRSMSAMEHPGRAPRAG
jgi:hypothetical protein